VSCSAFASVCLRAWHADHWCVAVIALAALGLAPALWRLLRDDAAGAVSDLGRWLLLAVWVGAMPACWIALRAQVPWSAMVGAILAVKCNDIGAYFAGHAFGRHRMAPWISPAKTWEGFAGGALASIAAGAWVGSTLPAGMWHGIAFGACAALLGPFGDLAESILKRHAGAKDSGTMLPGMGGALDVLDSLLPTAPAALWLLGARS
jgi:phosphatidate cytidylyltransferase